MVVFFHIITLNHPWTDKAEAYLTTLFFASYSILCFRYSGIIMIRLNLFINFVGSIMCLQNKPNNIIEFIHKYKVTSCVYVCMYEQIQSIQQNTRKTYKSSYLRSQIQSDFFSFQSTIIIMLNPRRGR